MKDSSVPWLGEVPSNWDIVRIKHPLKERKENNKPQKTENVLSLLKDRGVIPYDEKGDIGNKSKENLEDYKLAYPGDIVLNSMNVIIGSVGISEYFGAVSPVYYMLNTRYPEDSIKYLNYIFQTDEFQKFLVGYGNGILAHRMRIPMQKLNTIMIPYPNHEIQHRIAAHLDQKVSLIDNIIEKTKLSIEEYKKYKQSLIAEIVTKGLNKKVKMKDSGIEWIGEIPEHWDIIRPLKVCELIRGNSNFQKTDLSNQGEYVAVQYGKIYKVEEVDAAYQFYVDKSFHKESQVVRYDDTILISTSETMGDLGHSCYYNRKDDGLLGGEQLCLRPDTNILNGKFLYYATQYFKYELNQYATGLKVFRFRTDDLKKITMVIPPIEEQKLLVNFLDNKIPVISKIISNKESLIEELASYKKSLTYEFVTGKREVM